MTATITRVDAAPVRAHLTRLNRAGIGRRRASELSGVARSTLQWITHGTSAYPPPKMTAVDIADRILAVPAHPGLAAPSALIDSAGTVRRLQALIAVGWPTAYLVVELGLSGTHLWRLMDRARVKASTAAAVRDLYERLWNTEPPQVTAEQRRAVSWARHRAGAHGWPPPAGWDDDLIDLPEAELAAELDRLTAQMGPAELTRCYRAAREQGDRSPLVVAGAVARGRQQSRRPA